MRVQSSFLQRIHASPHSLTHWSTYVVLWYRDGWARGVACTSAHTRLGCTRAFVHRYDAAELPALTRNKINLFEFIPSGSTNPACPRIIILEQPCSENRHPPPVVVLMTCRRTGDGSQTAYLCHVQSHAVRGIISGRDIIPAHGPNAYVMLNHVHKSSLYSFYPSLLGLVESAKVSVRKHSEDRSGHLLPRCHSAAPCLLRHRYPPDEVRRNHSAAALSLPPSIATASTLLPVARFGLRLSMLPTAATTATAVTAATFSSGPSAAGLVLRLATIMLHRCRQVRMPVGSVYKHTCSGREGLHQTIAMGVS